MFAQTQARAVRPWTFPVSVMVQVGLISTAILAPMIHIEPMPRVRLVAPRLVPPHVRLVEVPPALRQLLSRPSSAPALNYRQVFRLPSARTQPQTGISSVVDTSELPDLPVGEVGLTGDLLTRQASVVLPPKPAANVSAEAVPRQPEPPPPVARTYRVGGDVKAPVLKLAVRPDYPPLARAARIQGTVRLNGVVTKEGVVRSLVLIEGHPLLVAAAMSAVRGWQYEAGRLNGQPVDVQIVIEVNFKLAQ